MSILAISGKKGSGKDVVGKIIQYLTSESNVYPFDLKLDYSYRSNWQIKKFADKLKDIICILINCTREQLEDESFKSKELDEEWWCWYMERDGGYSPIILDYLTTTKKQLKNYEGLELIKPTPRFLLQFIGTDLLRNQLHPEIWVNSLMSEYKQIIGYAPGNYWNKCSKCGKQFIGDKRAVRCEECSVFYPNWIITDMRFPNELEAVKKRNGITIRVNREIKNTSEKWQEIYPDVVVLDPDGWNRDSRFQFEWHEEKITLKQYVNKVLRSTCKFKVDFNNYFNIKEHPSETAIDDATFDYVIENSGSIEELVEKVKQILIKEKLL